MSGFYFIAAKATVSDCMDKILALFQPGARITVLVRRPGEPDQDFCMTNDDLQEVIAMAERRLLEGRTG